VSSQLASLQTEVVNVTALLAEDQKKSRGSPRAWALAFLVLCCSGVVVVAAIHQGLTASADAAAAGRLQAQFDGISSRAERALHAGTAASCKQSVSAAAKCQLQLNSALYGEGFQTLISEDPQLQADQNSAHRLELEGPAVLAFGSALAGAVLGWMLTQWLASYSRPGFGKWSS
jgi:hypothetical protein